MSFKNIDLSPRRVFVVFALIALALLGEALILQHLKDVAPCPLCIVQREAFLVLALVALVAAVHGRGAAAYAGGVALAAACGLGVAIWHVWDLHHPKFGCGIDVMERIVNDLPTAKLLPFMFYASGSCSARHEPIFGLQVPEWSLLWFALFLLAAVFFLVKWLRAAPARSGG